MATRVLIADDHAIVRAGLRALLHSETGMELVGEATGGIEALALAAQLQPDILVMDLSMPDMDGIRVSEQLRVRLPAIRILILTVHEDEDLVRGAIRAGAAGYILKQAAEAELIAAIRTVLTGELYVPSHLLRSLIVETRSHATSSPRPADLLTPRELDVLGRLVQGYTNRQIADELQLSVRTVESYRANLTDKLNLRSRADLVRYAREHGLLQGPGT